MKMKKFLVVVVAIMSMALGSTTAFAADFRAVGANDGGKQLNPANNITGESVPTAEQYAAYMQGLSEYDLQQIAAKEAIAAQRINPVITRAGTKITVPGTFTMYQQETDTYCIPATIKSILMYINGTSPSQKDIAGTTGTDPTKIPGYLNDRQNQCYYVYVDGPSKDDMCAKLYSTISYSKVPCSMGISGTSTSNWYYTTTGHSLVVNGIYDDYSYIQFGDPLGDRVAGCPYFYTKTADVASSVCTRIVY